MKSIILTAHHKNDIAIPIFKEYFFPIQVGASLSDVNLGIGRDDSGENISSKNRNYCELTAYYYALKNLDFDSAGLMHYRRIFLNKAPIYKYFKKCIKYFMLRAFDLISIKDLSLSIDPTTSIGNLGQLKKEVSLLDSFLKSQGFEDVDIVLPKKIKYAYLNVKQQYSINHSMYDLEKFNEIIIKKYPFFRGYIKSVNDGRALYPYNMYIMKKKFFEDYNNMLFLVLEEMESYIDLSLLNSYQSRIFGFLSERFLNYYVEMIKTESNIEIMELDTAFIHVELL
jgi:hypothetical protein|tara:strand:- start:377 stop:1225 length:849 start_codon:yes stop_codon:yes gene_type:complete